MTDVASSNSFVSVISALFAYALIAAGMFMTGWGFFGFLEYFSGPAPIVPLQNPAFPAGTQFLHWLAILSSGLVFLIGYFSKWRHTPHAMVVAYAVLATLCFVETFDFMTNANRYSAMVFEYAAYAAISIYLFRSQRMRSHFGTDD